ncbi:hypothetical protein [Chroococcidiopsis sp. CCMEE 29]|nr:hypothetical protein [Chroococcidiopsis sp. CCMEE 29]
MAQLQDHWDELRMECDRCLVIRIYEDQTAINRDLAMYFLML